MRSTIDSDRGWAPTQEASRPLAAPLNHGAEEVVAPPDIGGKGLIALPNTCEAHLLRASALVDLGRLDEAALHYREALRFDRASAVAHAALGNVLQTLGRDGEAEAFYRQALRLRPEFAEVHNNLGNLLRHRNDAEAEAAFREALRLKAAFPEAANNLGELLWHQNRHEEAEQQCRRALELRPGYVSALNNLGNVLASTGRRIEAEAAYREALRLDPRYVEAHNNLAGLLHDLGRNEEGIQHFREAVRLRPDYPEARCNLAMAVLRTGAFEEGWLEYEWRFKTRKHASEARAFAAPVWNGEDLAGQTLLVYAEQGFGDTIQFCRFAPALGARARVVLEVPRHLVRLLSTLEKVDQVVVQGDPLPPFDYYLPLLSAPHRLAHSIADLPGAIPYLRPDQALAKSWAARLDDLDGLRVGLVWAGNANLASDRQRSIPFDLLTPLLEVDGVSFVSLQKGASAVGHRIWDWTSELGDFADTAALIDGLDLVISVDTAVAHLAGALAKPVWLLNRYNTCWRWLLGRDDSPWYPTLRQFRQPAFGDWTSVVATVASALTDLVRHHPDGKRMTRRLLTDALVHHRAGRLDKAEPIYAAILERDPSHAAALHLHGVAALQGGRPDRARRLIEQAIAVNPDIATYHCNLGSALKAQGEHDLARAAYEQAIHLEPREIDAYNNLGNLLRDSGSNEAAERVYTAAIAVAPDAGLVRLNYGDLLARTWRAAEAETQYREAILHAASRFLALTRLGGLLEQRRDLAGAEALYREAIALDPAAAALRNNLGLVLMNAGRFEEAEAELRAAISLDPSLAEAHSNLGNILRLRGAIEESIAACHTAITCKPELPSAHGNLGCALRDAERFPEAEDAFRRALALDPASANFHSNLGTVVLELGRTEEAESEYWSALTLDPGFADAHANLGTLCHRAGRWAEAETHYRKALEINPVSPDGHGNIANLFSDIGRVSEGLAHFREAARLRPGDADFHCNLGIALLRAGQLAEGWPEYEWRWKTKRHARRTRNFAPPLWDGEAMSDRVLLLHAEQGFGDTLQFCRFAPIIGRNSRVVLEVPKPLVGLLSCLPGIEQIVARGDRLPAFDAHCPLLGIPKVLGTVLATIPGETPYLRADPVLAASWHTRLEALPGLRVGFVWAGNPEMAADSERSLPVDQLAPLGEIAGVSLVSLQKDARRHGVRSPALALHDWTDELGEFADTAALIDGLDLVISVDTSVAHLAGALGKPVWLMNRFNPCWRWLLDRDDSPWYPTLRQFRQPAPGDWRSVVLAVERALRDRRATQVSGKFSRSLLPYVRSQIHLE